MDADRKRLRRRQIFTLEKADGTAKYANHANAERIRRGDRFSQRVNVLVH